MACEYSSLGLHVGNHSRPTPLALIVYFPLFCSPAMERSEVLNIVDTAIAKNNDSLVDSMKRILNESLSEIKRANSESADSHLREIKKFKFEEPRRFKKKANEDQYRFNSKMSDVLTEAKSSWSSQQLDKVKESLDNDSSSAMRPIPTLDGQLRSQIKPGSCFACSKPGHWRAQCPLLPSKPRAGQ